MGINDRKRSEKEDRAAKAATKRKRRDHTTSGGSPADYSGVDGILLGKAIASVARGGGAVRFGYTRDGGAYAVGFYEGDDYWTEYVPPSDDFDTFLRGVIEDYE